MTYPYHFAGGVAVITGAASGIGRALSMQLAAHGSHLALIDRDEQGLDGLVTQLRTMDPALRLSTHLADLNDVPSLAAVVEDVLSVHRRVTLLINNAGMSVGGTFDMVGADQFARVMNVNFNATVALCRAFLPSLKSGIGTHIVNVSSVYGLFGPAEQTAYTASKFAVRGFTESLRHELEPLGIGVTVVHPGGVNTNIVRNAEAPPGLSEEVIEARRREIQRTLLLPPEEAARQILEGVQRRSPRVLVGNDAKLMDVLVRTAPARYWTVLKRVYAVRQKRKTP